MSAVSRLAFPAGFVGLGSRAEKLRSWRTSSLCAKARKRLQYEKEGLNVQTRNLRQDSLPYRLQS